MPASAAKKTERLTPPYGSLKTCRAFIEKLKKTVVPDVLDRSMMSHMSGVSQAETFSAYRFLGLLGESDTTQDSLKKLVDAFGTDKWAPTLAPIVTKAYKPILGELNTKTATAKALADKFRTNANVDGHALTRAVQFYLAALKEAEIPHSPLFKAPTRPKSATNGKNKSEKPKGGVAPADNNRGTTNEELERVPDGTRRYPLYFKGDREGALYVPVDLSPADCKVIELQLAVLKAYAGADDDGR